MKDILYERLVFIINNARGTQLFPDRECFKIIKFAYPHVSDNTLGSIYSAEYSRRMKKNHFRLSKIVGELHEQYVAAVEDGEPEGILLRMSDEVDLSPALLARLIVQYQYKEEFEAKALEKQLAEQLANESKQVAPTATEENTNSSTDEVAADETPLKNEENSVATNKAPPATDTLADTTQDRTSDENEKNTDKTDLNLVEGALSIISNDLAVDESTTVKIKKKKKKATLSDTKVVITNEAKEDFTGEATQLKITNTPVSNLIEEAVLNVSEISANKDSTENIEEQKCSETKGVVANCNEMDDKATEVKISSPAELNLTKGATASIVRTAPNLIEYWKIRTEEARFLANKVAIANGHKLDDNAAEAKISSTAELNLTKDATASIVSTAPNLIEFLKKETEKARFLATKKITGSAASTEFKSEVYEGLTEKEISILNDSLPKVTLTSLMINTKLIEDARLATEAFSCVVRDDQYGPVADSIKHALGLEYEMEMVRLARAAGLNFHNEGCLRVTGFDKTPDIKLETPVLIDGYVITWIESKALFGDEETHLEYHREQYQFYYSRYGPGLVIYWFGFQDKILQRFQSQMMIMDSFPKEFEFPEVPFDTFSFDPEAFEEFLDM